MRCASGEECDVEYPEDCRSYGLTDGCRVVGCSDKSLPSDPGRGGDNQVCCSSLRGSVLLVVWVAIGICSFEKPIWTRLRFELGKVFTQDSR